MAEFEVKTRHYRMDDGVFTITFDFLDTSASVPFVREDVVAAVATAIANVLEDVSSTGGGTSITSAATRYYDATEAVSLTS